MSDNVWYNQQKYEASEALYQRSLAGTTTTTTTTSTNQAKQTGASSIKNELAQARQQIQKVLTSGGSSGADGQVLQRVESLEKENKSLKQVLDDMKAVIQRLEGRVSSLEGNKAPASTKPAQAPAAAKPAAADDDADDDFDLFGSDDEEDAEAERIKQERLKEYREKKAKKPQVIAKSNIILDVKPWDDETDMKELEKAVRAVVCDGLVWGASKLVPVGYGIKKLQITCVIEDDKVSTDFLEEEITANEDYVQSVDIAAFNKI